MSKNNLMDKKVICWFPRDLRLNDHHALARATLNSKHVIPLFIFDEHILGELRHLHHDVKSDARVTFILDAIESLRTELQKKGHDLYLLHGKPEIVLPEFVKEMGVEAVDTNHDYEPYAKKRDSKVKEALAQLKPFCDFFDYKDQVIFERDEILTAGGTPFKVFTAYKNCWRKAFSQNKEQLLHEWKPKLTHLISAQEINKGKWPHITHSDLGFVAKRQLPKEEAFFQEGPITIKSFFKASNY